MNLRHFLLALPLIGSLLPALAAPIVITGAGVHFSRSSDCQKVVLQEIDAESQAVTQTRTIQILMYTFTDSTIADHLIAAAKNGVAVTVVLDASQASLKNSQYLPLKAALGDSVILCHGLPYPDGDGYGIMHEKLTVLGGNVVMEGSYNFTASAHRYNWEDLHLFAVQDISPYQAEFNAVYNYAKANPTGPIHNSGGF